VVSLVFEKHMAEIQKSEAVVINQQRLAKEEMEALAKKKGKGAGRGAGGAGATTE
jgi:hypothetical protein